MDLALLHAPSVFDFREESIFFGPISDVVPSTPVFEMYPVGLASIAAYLEERGHKTRIVNLAYRMLEDHRFDPVKMIKKINSPLFGIDLHWLTHAQGSLAVAGLVKENHPKSKVVFGGLSSTYFHRELIAYPDVDFVLRGDSTEEPLRLLIQSLKSGGGFETVPNLTWKDDKGEVHENPVSHVPENLDYTDFSYRHVLKHVFRYRDLKSVIPFQDWLRYPITMPLLCRGCTENCVICGGSKYSFKRFYGRDKIAFRSPERFVDDIVRLGRMTRAPVFLVGDIRQAGLDFAEEVLDRLARSDIENDVIFEFFRGVDENFMKKISESVPGFSIEISPETHDEEIRMAAGKLYTNLEFENTLRYALKYGAKKIDIFYMVGIPRQDYKSVMETVEYSWRLVREIGTRKNVYPFISPLAPFLDPGSIAFEEPDKVGYRLKFKTLEEHRKALLAPSWKHTLNYETEWMNTDEIAEATYEAALRLTDIRAEEGILDAKKTEEQRKKIIEAQRIVRDIDRMMETDGSEGADLSQIYRNKLEKSRISTLIDHKELQWLFPGRGIRIRRVLAERLKWLIRGQLK